MAELNVKNPSLADVLSRTNPAGNIAQIIELAEKMNPIVRDAIYTECNDGTKHHHIITLSVSTAFFKSNFRNFYEFVISNKHRPQTFSSFPCATQILTK